MPPLMPPVIPPPTLVLPLPFFIPIPTPIPLLIPVPSDKYYSGSQTTTTKKEIPDTGVQQGGTIQNQAQSRPPSANVMMLNDVQAEIMSDCSSNNENEIILDEQRRRRRALIIDKPSHTER